MNAHLRSGRTALVSVAALFLIVWIGPGSANETNIHDGEGVRHILSIFEGISQIPRCSKHEDRISAWLAEWAEQRNLPVKRDEHRNVLITVPASAAYEDRPAVVLQAHMDMVCQKTEDSPHDFSKDPIVLVRDGDWLRARDTTLGADDGIGIAIALALAEDAATPHPKLELLFTTDEEVDMTGAGGLASGFITGTRLVNLDSETEGAITLGAAGGRKLDISLPMTFAPLGQQEVVFALRVDGLLGGHSGIDIDKGRANANVLLAQALSSIPLRLISFSGGTADNAITRNSEALFAVPAAQVDPLEARIVAFEQKMAKQFPGEKELSLTLSRIEKQSDEAALEADSAKAVEWIANLPQGVQDWSTEFTGLPETSSNVGVVATEHDTLRVTALPRSFSPEKLEGIVSLIEAGAAQVGAAATRRSEYPAWPPRTDSELYRKSLAVYEGLFKTPLRTEVVHAGLETGYFAEQYDSVEIISIGPNLENVHTPRERLYVPSLERISQFLRGLMRAL